MFFLGIYDLIIYDWRRREDKAILRVFKSQWQENQVF